MLQRVESFIREQALIEPGGEVTVPRLRRRRLDLPLARLGGLGYRVSALHVAHGLRGAESDEDARFCREVLGAEVVACVSEHGVRPRPSCASCRYSFATDRLRATGHTASDQIESVLLGLVASGSPQRIKARREDGDRAAAARRLAGGDARLLRASTGSQYREDSSNPGTKRGLIRNEILPLLEQLDPRARASLLSLADERPRLPRTLERTLAELLASRDGTKSADLGAGVRAVREYGTLRLEGSVEWGPWTIASERDRARGAGAPAGGSPRRPAEESAGSARGREGAAERSATAGRSSCAVTRSSPCRVSPRPRAGKER